MRGRRTATIAFPVLSIVVLGVGCGDDDDTKADNISGICTVADKVSGATIGEISVWLKGEGTLLASVATIVASALLSAGCGPTLTYMIDHPDEPITLRFTTDNGIESLNLIGSDVTSKPLGQCSPLVSPYAPGKVIWCDDDGTWQVDFD